MSIRGATEKLVIVAAILVATLASGLGAMAYFSTAGSGTATALVGDLEAPTITAATPGTGTAALTWSAVTPPEAGTVAYYVTRDGGNAGGNCAVSSSPTAATSCTDSALAVGTYEYTVTAVWRTWTATSSNSPVTVSTAVATHLAFNVQPSNTVAGSSLTPAITVRVLDASNNVVTSDSSTEVTLAIGTNPGSGTLSGTVMQTASSGVATFSGVSINKAGTGYTLAASDTTGGGGIHPLTGATSSTFDITPGTATKLVFTTSPQTITAGGASSGTITVERQDANSNPTTLGGALTVALTSSSGDGTFRDGADLSTITTIPIASGAANADLRYRDATVGGPTITAASSPLTSATQGVTVTAAGTVVARASTAWNVASTWLGTPKTGTITTSNASTAVTGVGTSFTTQLVIGDAIYRSDGTTLIGIVSTITNNTQLVLVANAATNNTNILYTGSRVPTAPDNVFIGTGATDYTVSIPSGYAAVANSLTMGNNTDNTAAVLNFTDATSSLAVGGNIDLHAPDAGATSNLNVAAGTLTAGGNITFANASTTTNHTNRLMRLSISSGSVSVGENVVFDSVTSTAGSEIGLAILFSGAGTLTTNTIEFQGTGRATLTPATGTVVFRSLTAQSIPIGVSNVTYNNVIFNNTSAGGATLSAAAGAGKITGDVTIASGATLNVGNFTHSLAGDFTNNGTFNANGSTMTFAGSTPQAIGGSSQTTFNNLTVTSTNTVTLNTSGSVTGDLTVSGGTFDLGASTIDRATAGGVLTVGAGDTLKIGGTNGFPANYTTRTLDVASIVNYSGVNQTVSQESYGNLTLSGSGTKTLPGMAMTVAGALTTSGTVTAIANAALTVNGDTIIGSGTTVNAGAFSHSLGGNFANSGTFNASTSTVTFNGTGAQSIGGSSTTTFNNLTINKSAGTATLTANESVGNNLSVQAGTLTLSTFTLNGSGSGTFSLSNSTTLNVGGTNNFPTSYGTTSLGVSSNVNYNAAAAQTVSSQAYGNLTLSGSGIKSMPALTVAGAFATSGTANATPSASLTVSGDATIGANTTFTAGSSTHFFAGNFTNGGTISAGTSTLVFNGTGAQTITGTATTTFNNFAVNKSSGTVTLGRVVAVTGDLSVSAGTLDIASFTANRSSAGGTLTVSPGATMVIGGTGGFPTNYSTHSLAAASTVVYDGTSQAVAGESYGNLTIGLSGTGTLAANGTVAGDVTVSTGTLALGTFTLNRATSGGTLTLAGGTTLSIGGPNGFPSNYAIRSLAATSTVIFGGTTQSVSGETYGNLTTTSTASLIASATVAGNLSVTAGTLDLSTFTLDRTSAGGTLTLGAAATLRIGGTNGFPANYTTHTLNASSTVNYAGTTQSVSGEAYGNLTISLSSTGTLAATSTVAGNLTVSSGTLDVTTFTLNRTTSGGTLSVGAGATLKIGGTNGFPTNYTARTLNATSTVDYSGTSQTVTNEAYGNLTLSGSGAKTLPGTAMTIAGALTTGGTATATAGAAITVSGSTTVGSGSTLVAGSFTHLLAGNFTNNGTLIGGTSTVTFNGTGAQTIGGSTTTAFNNVTISKSSGTATLAANATAGNNLTVSTGTLDLATFTLDGAGTLAVSNGATLLVGASNFPTGYATTSLGVSSTVNYNGASQTVTNQTYGNLTLSGSGAKTLPGTAMTVAGALTTSGTATATAGAAIIVSGNTTIGAGTTVDAGSFTHLLAGNFTNNGTLSGGTITVTFNGTAAQSIGGSTSTTFNNLTISKSSGTATLAASAIVGNNLTVSTGTLDLATFTLDGAIAGAFAVSNGATLFVGGTNNFPAGYGTTSLGASSTVNYNGAAQTIASQTYGNLTLSGSAAKTLPGTAMTIAGTLATSGTVTATAGAALIVNGDTTIGSGTTLNAGSFSHLLGGNFTNSGTFTASTGTVTFNGTGAQSIGGTSTTFNNLTINKSAGTATLTANETVAGNLTVSSGTLALSTFTVNRSPGGGTISLNNGATLNVGGANNFPTGYTTTTLGTSSTVNYNGATQTVSAQTYGNLTTGGTLTKTLGGAVIVNGNLTIGASTTVATSNNNIALGGDWTNGGTFTQGTSTVTFGGSSSQILTGATTFSGFTVNNASGLTLASNQTVTGTLTLTSGIVTTGANTLVTNGTVARTSGHVFGNLQKPIATGTNVTATFDIGGATNYRPASLTFASVSVAGSVTARQTTGQEPNIATAGIKAAKDVNAYWTLTRGGSLAFTTYGATFNFIAGDILGGANTSTFIVKRYDTAWSATTTGTRTSTSTQVSGVTTLGSGGASDFAIGEPVASQLAVTSVNGGGNVTSGATFSVVVQTRDLDGNAASVDTDTGVTLSVGTGTGTLGGTIAGTILAGTNQVTIGGVTYANNSGESNVVLTATRTSGDTPSSGNSAPFTVVGSASTLAFVQQPANVIAGQAIAPVTVEVRDANGSRVTSSSASIAMAIGANPGSATLGGTLTQNAVSGLATFNDLSLNKVANGYTLAASSTGLTGATSSTFNVTPGNCAWNSTNGTWSTQANWTCDGVVGARIPLATDNVTIRTASTTVTVDIDASAYSLVTGPTNNSAQAVTLSSGKSLNVVTDLTINRPTGGNIAALNVNDGTVTIGGGVTYTGTAGAGRIAKIAIASGTLTVAGDFTFSTGAIADNVIDMSVAPQGGTLNVAGNVGSSATLTAGVNSTVNYNGTSSQTIGALAYDHLTLTGAATKTSAGALTAAGTLTIGAGATFAASTFAHTVSGNWVNNGTFTAGLSTVTFNATSTIGGSNTTAFNNLTTNTGTVTLANTVTVAGNLTVSSGTLDLGTFTADRMTSGSGLTVASGATLRIGGTNSFPANYTAPTLTGSTVDYNGTTQTVAALNYNNLTISGNHAAGTVTLASGTIGVAAAFTASATSVSYSTTGNTVNYNGAGGQTIAAFNYNNLTSSAAGARTLANTGTIVVAETFTPGTNAYTTTGSTVDFNGSGAQTVPALLYNNLTISGARTTNSVTLASTGTIGVAGTFSPTATFGGGGYFSTGSTVNYNAAGAQSVAAFAYNNLALSVSGAKTLPGSALTIAGTLTTTGTVTATAAAAVTVTGDITIGSGTTFTAGAFTHSFAGNFSNSGTFTATGSNVVLNGTSAQSISGATTNTTFNNLTISNSSAAVSASVNFNVSGAFTVGAGAVFTPAAAVVINTAAAAGAITGSGTVQVTRTAATADYSSQYKFTTTTLASLTVEYTAAANQIISAVTYGNLKTSGSGNKTAAAALTVNGNLTVGSGTTFITGAFSHSIGGNFTNNGAFTATGSTVTFNGTSPQTISGSATTFINLTISNSSGVSLSGVDATATGTLTLGSSILTTGSNKMIVTTTLPSRTTGYVNGALQRTGSVSTMFFAVGNGANDTGVSVVLSACGGTCAVTVRSTAGEHPNVSSPASGINPATDVNTYWTLSLNAGTATWGTVTFNYPSTNLDGGTTPSAFVVKRWNGSSWSAVTTTGTPTNSSTSVTGLTSATLGDFIIGNP